MGWQERIKVDAKIMSGKPVIQGTRVPVQAISAALAGGDDIACVCDQFMITEADVRAALAYAANRPGDQASA